MDDNVQADIINRITHNLHSPVPGTGAYHQSISVGNDQELVQVAGSAPAIYSSVENYLAFQLHAYALTTQVELVAAQQLYGREFRVTIHGSPSLQQRCRLPLRPFFATLTQLAQACGISRKAGKSANK